MPTFLGPTLRLRPQRALPLWCGHPWVVAGALGPDQPLPESPCSVAVLDDKGRTIDFGLYAPDDPIRVRLLGVGPLWPQQWPADNVPWRWWERRLEAALQARRRSGTFAESASAFRLINAEGDGMPGLIVDWIGGVARVTLASQALQPWLEEIVAWLVRHADVRHAVLVGAQECDQQPEEGEAHHRWLTPAHEGPVEILETGLRILVDVTCAGQARWTPEGSGVRRACAPLAAEASVLEAGETSGGFGLHAAACGASSVRIVTANATVADLIRETAGRNGFQERVVVDIGGLQGVLASQVDRKQRHGLVALHPPCLAPERKSLPAALRMQRTLARDGLRIVDEGGRLALPATSRLIGEAELLRAVTDALGKARLQAVVEAASPQDADFPWPAAMREGRGVPWLVLRRLSRGGAA